MMRYSVVLLWVFVIKLNALTLQEAVDKALKHNLDIKLSEHYYAQSKYSVELKTIPFLPKLDAQYDYNQYNRVGSTSQKREGVLKTTLSYNLFNGFQDRYNKEASQLSSEMNFHQLNALKQDIMLKTKEHYINVLYQEKRLITFQRAYELFEKQYQDANNRFNQGLLSRNDLLHIDVNRSSAKQDIVRVQGDHLMAKERLKHTLGLMDETLEVLQPLSHQLSWVMYDKKRLDNRSELQALHSKLKSIYKNRASTKNSALPTVDTSLTHKQFYHSLSFDRNENSINDQNMVSLTVSWDLDQGLTTQIQDKIYLSELSAIKAQIKQVELDIQLQYTQAKTNLDVAKSNYDTALLSLKQAQENYTIVNNRFNEGIDSSTDLIDANYLLTLSKENQLKAYFDQYLADASLQRVFEYE